MLSNTLLHPLDLLQQYVHIIAQQRPSASTSLPFVLFGNVPKFLSKTAMSPSSCQMEMTRTWGHKTKKPRFTRYVVSLCSCQPTVVSGNTHLRTLVTATSNYLTWFILLCNKSSRSFESHGTQRVFDFSIKFVISCYETKKFVV